MSADHTNVAIIGAGIAGIILGIKLKQAGIDDFVIYERDTDVAGTWLTNTYPGCRSDVPAHWYSLSTHLNPNWTVSHPPQPEVLAYWKRIVELEDLRPHIQFRTALESAKWNSSTSQYDLTLATGTSVETSVSGQSEDRSTVRKATARLLVSGVGGFSIPMIPNIPGLPGRPKKSLTGAGDGHGNGIANGGTAQSSDSGIDLSEEEEFGGLVVHSARYPREGLDLRNKSVAVLGNGCSGAQIVPTIAEDSTTTVYACMRSGQWFLPNEIPAITEARKQRYANYPLLLRLHRLKIYLLMDPGFYGIWIKNRRWLRNSIEKKIMQYVRRVAPKECHEVLIPDFPLGAKRVIRDVGYLKSLNQPNVKPSMSGIKRLTKNAIITNDGQTLPISVIVLATGFDVMASTLDVYGRDGVSLKNDIDKETSETGYHGMARPGYPNFFMMLGQNTAPGHASVIFQLEVQSDYIAQCCLQMKNDAIKVLEVKAKAQTAYNSWINNKLSKTVWTEGSGFYHLGNKKGGRITTNWPAAVAVYWFQNAIPRWRDWVGAENAAKKQYGWWTLCTVYTVISTFLFQRVKVVKM